MQKVLQDCVVVSGTEFFLDLVGFAVGSLVSGHSFSRFSPLLKGMNPLLQG